MENNSNVEDKLEKLKKIIQKKVMNILIFQKNFVIFVI